MPEVVQRAAAAKDAYKAQVLRQSKNQIDVLPGSGNPFGAEIGEWKPQS